jgi:hypothetical protein
VAKKKAIPAKKTGKEEFPIRLKGTVSWVCENGEFIIGVPVKMAVIPSKDEIAIDVENQGYDYPVRLSKCGPQYEGRFNGDSWEGKSPVIAFGKLYSNDDGYLFHGTWREQYEWYWWAELSEIKE